MIPSGKPLSKIGLNEDKEVEAMVDYLVSVAPIMGFEFLYYNTRDDKGNEHKELMWIS